MSDPYGLANPAELTITFAGEVPAPSSISANEPGISNQKANADHSHALDIGGVDTPWQNILLAAGVTNFGGTWRSAQYSRVGNLVFVRGVVNCSGAAAAFPLVIGTLPVGYFSSTYSELGTGSGFGGVYRIDIATNGQIQVNGVIGGGAPNPAFLSLGTPYMIFALD